MLFLCQHLTLHFNKQPYLWRRLKSSRLLQSLINVEDNVTYLWSAQQFSARWLAQKSHPCYCLLMWVDVSASGLFQDQTIVLGGCVSASFCSSSDLGYLSSGWILLLCCRAVQPAGPCNLQWHTMTRASVQISVLKQKRPQQMWHCKTTSRKLSRLWYSNLKCVRVCVCDRESSTLLLTAEITSPADLRTVLCHGGSWNNDLTFEPQSAPDQMVDLLIKYLSAPGNYPTSVLLFSGHCITGSWSSTKKFIFLAERQLIPSWISADFA